MTATLEENTSFIGSWTISGSYSDEELTQGYPDPYNITLVSVSENSAILYYSESQSAGGNWETQEGDYQYIFTVNFITGGTTFEAKINVGAQTGILKTDVISPGVYIYYSLVKNPEH